jgi:hypothetical protein
MKNIFKLLAISIAISFSSCQKEVLIQIDIVLIRTLNSFQSCLLIRKHQLIKFRDGFNGNGIIEIVINGQA